MRTIFCLFDSLNRKALGAYGGTDIPTPNFDRFADRAVTFDNHFVGSLPCMPARRDMHTGRLNFTHCSWGPLEPFDNSCADLLQKNGVYTHLVTDHCHYFEDGGAAYHTRFSSFDFIRGQENDPWKAMVQAPLERFRERWDDGHYPIKSGRVDDPGRGRIQHMINRVHMEREEEQPCARCYASGLEFLDANKGEDDWFLMLECFDPHEPFDAPERFKKNFPTGWAGKTLNWPHYEIVSDSPEEIAEIRANYAALVAMCDHYFGQLLDYMDANDMWEDTALILTTDHGFLLAEHNWWGKNLQPYYREISHIPLIMHHPDAAGHAGSRVQAITQTYDLMPTLLNIYDSPIPDEVTGKSFLPHLLEDEADSHDIAVFGMFGGPLGASDGRYDYYIYPEDLYEENMFEYTLMPAHIRSLMSIEELKTAELFRGFDFTKGAPILKVKALQSAKRIPNVDGKLFENNGTKLFETWRDPEQKNPVTDPTIETRLRRSIRDVLVTHDAPEELFRRFCL